jgi:tetratricopeptide (TPR) repeat protein
MPGGLMAFLAYCAPVRIPLTLVEGAIDDEIERMAALAGLFELSLVKHDRFEDGEPAVTVHRLVQAVAGARSKAKGSAHSALVRLMTRLAVIYPHDGYRNPASWPRCAQLTPHLLVSCETELAGLPSPRARLARLLPILRIGSAPDVARNAKRADLLSRAGSYFHGRAIYSEARPLLERVLAICEKALGPEDLSTAGSLNNLALLLTGQGDLAAAQPHYERALAIYEKALGPEHPSTAASLNNLASLLQDQGDLLAARPLYERVLAIWESALGLEHPDTARSLNNLACLLQTQGDLAGARPLFERAWRSPRRSLAPSIPIREP